MAISGVFQLLPPSLRRPQQIVPHYFWKQFDNFLFDADGVLWREQKPLAGAVELIGALLGSGKRVFIVTNNATRTASEFITKCSKLGFTDLDEQHIVSSGAVLANQLNKMKRSVEFAATSHLPVYLVGSAGLKGLLAKHGIESFGTGPDTISVDVNGFISDLPALDGGVPRPFAVVGGYDIHFSYAKVMRAVNWLKEAAMPFLVTNEDATFPGPNPDIIVPGAGTVTSVLRHVSGREPLVMGKPSAICWEYICERVGSLLDPQRTLMVGDRCDTDIHFGRLNGLSTLLVLSGVHSMSDVDRFVAEGRALLVPEFFANSLADLLEQTEHISPPNAVN